MRKFFSWLAIAVLSMSFCCGTVGMTFAQAQESPIVIIAGSDFQGNIPENKAVVRDILSNMKADGYTDVDGAFFCGDYTIQLNDAPSDSEEGLTALRSVYAKADMGIDEDEMIFVQGNHDPVGTYGLSKSGIHAPKGDDYGVFVIN